MDILFLAGRVLFGGYFVFASMSHFLKRDMLVPYAASRGVPAPAFLVPFSGLFILLGGLGVILGTYVEWAVLLLAAFLIPVTFWMHSFWKDEDPNMKMSNMINFQKNLALLGAALMFLAIPAPWFLRLF